MKKFSHIVSTTAVAAILMSGHVAFAQGDNNDTGGTTGGATATDNRDSRQDDNPDYGWLGLLGLAGLAGLLKKPERQVIHQHDPARPNQPVR